MTSSTQWVLARRPKGNDYEAALELETAPLGDLGDGQLLVKNRVLSMDSGTRMWMTDREDSYSPPLPLGTAIIGTNIAEVVSSRHPEFSPGDVIRCYGAWADQCIVDPRQVYATKVSQPVQHLREYVGIFGANGWTAYVGVIETGAVRAGDTFLVSAAAGCTGLMAGQVAKAAGCRVVGIAGSDQKCGLLENTFGFDAAINYKTGDLTEAIASACPEGVNVYFDNVGGPVLNAAMANMAVFGRVAVCGLITSYIADSPQAGPSKFDLVLMKRLRIEGFFSPDFYRRESEINPLLARWAEAGQLKLPFDVTQGLENTVSAYAKLFSGANVGKVVVELH